MKSKPSPPDADQWLGRARSNLALAGRVGGDIDFEDLCFEAQQAAEKAIKAVFVSRQEHFPFIHDLEKLLQQLEDNGVKIPKYVWEADELSRFAELTRYPGLATP